MILTCSPSLHVTLQGDHGAQVDHVAEAVARDTPRHMPASSQSRVRTWVTLPGHVLSQGRQEDQGAHEDKVCCCSAVMGKLNI